MTVNTWIVVAGDPAIGTLISTARSLGGEVTAAVVGTRQVADTVAAGGVDKVIWFGEPDDAPVEAYATAVADTVATTPQSPQSCWAGWGRANACCWVPSRPSCRRRR